MTTPTIKHKVVQFWQDNKQLGLAEYYAVESDKSGKLLAQFQGVIDNTGMLIQATLQQDGYYDTFKLDKAGKPTPAKVESGRLLAAKTGKPCIVQETSYDEQAKPLPNPIVNNILFQLPK